MAADQSFSFFRLFGDFDGNGSVNNADYVAFRRAYGKTQEMAGYLWYMDFDGNGVIDALDYARFQANQGTSV